MDEEQVQGFSPPGPNLTSRTTRSKKVFSPWATFQLPHPFNFAAKVQNQLDQTLARELAQLYDDEDDGDESALSSLPSSRETTPPPQAASSPSPPIPILDLQPVTPTAARTDQDRRKERRKASHKNARKKKREQASAAFGKHRVREKIQERYVRGDGSQVTCMKMEDIEVPNGGFVGNRGSGFPKRTYRLDELTGPSSKRHFTLLEWSGEKTVCLLGKDRRVIGVLAGNPGCHDWPDVVRQAGEALEARRERCVSVKGKKNKYRRGKFLALASGVSYGGGQTHPMNVKNHPKNQEVLDELNSLECFRRISGFSSSIMASRLPALYRHYADKIGTIYEQDPSLQRPFPTSIFSSTTYNFGPKTVCKPHLDDANVAYGQCSITPAGNYDYKRGGHLVLWECRLVVEFPPGSTILIPSAVVTHSNTAIASHETRFSFTQYTAGALFRWVENGCKTAASYQSLLSAEEIEQEKKKNLTRWLEGVALLPLVDLPSSDSQ